MNSVSVLGDARWFKHQLVRKHAVFGVNRYGTIWMGSFAEDFTRFWSIDGEGLISAGEFAGELIDFQPAWWLEWLEWLEWLHFPIISHCYPLVMTNIANWKDPPFWIRKSTTVVLWAIFHSYGIRWITGGYWLHSFWSLGLARLENLVRLLEMAPQREREREQEILSQTFI